MNKPKFSIMDKAPSAVCERGREIELTLPPKKEGGKPEPTGCFVMVRGNEGPTVKALHRARGNAFLALADGEKAKTQTIEEMEEEAIELAIVSTISWRGFTDHEGAEIPFNEEGGRELYSEPHFRAQVLSAAKELGKFYTN